MIAGASSSAEQDEEEDEGASALAQLQVEEITTNVETVINHYFTMSEVHLRCPIHMLQLAIKDAINKQDNITRLLLKVGEPAKKCSQKHPKHRGD